jgi:D-tyrosyl-tRNA(Tyr) deacylase
MRVLLQRVSHAVVRVNHEEVGRIGQGLLVFVGFTASDSLEVIEQLAKKIVHLRVFDDAAGVMNLSVLDQQCSILSVSQFTLYADTSKGNRPSYSSAAAFEQAKQWYTQFNQALAQYCPVATGIFGAQMAVELVNDGPVTISLELH